MVEQRREVDRDDLIRLLGSASAPMSIADVSQALERDGLDY